MPLYICGPTKKIMHTIQVHNNQASKQEIYTSLIPQIKALIEPEANLVANLANISAVLKDVFKFWWVGFYLVDNTELVLGPFQGPVACTRIQFNKGVCGTCWAQKTTQVVPNVHEFPGHIACSAATNSEIVVPVFNSKNEVVAVLDIDSEQFNTFTEEDKTYLEEIAQLITNQHFNA